MNKIAKSVVATALAGSAIAGVNACGAFSPDPVSGDRDDVRWAPARTYTETKKKTENGKTKTTTKTKHDPACWCVELDNVNGHADADDQWYRVTNETFEAAKDADEGSPVKFTPLAEGC